MVGRFYYVLGFALLLSCSTASQVLEVATVGVDPQDGEITTEPGNPGTLELRARVEWSDGRVEYRKDVAWSVTNRSVGEVDEAGVFLASEHTGGITLVKASYLGQEGSATLTVFLRQTVFDGVDPALAEAVEAATPQDVPGVNPEVVYPPDGVFIPRNTPQIRFMFDAPSTFAFYRLRFQSAVTEVTVYTTNHDWIPDDELWLTIAATNAGGTTEWRLAGIEQVDLGNGPEVSAVYEAGQALRLNIARLDALGSIYYWSSVSAEQGIKQIPFGSVSATSYYTKENTGHCVSCHTVSRDGSQIAVTLDGGNGSLAVLDVQDPFGASNPVPAGAGPPGNFQTFNPDGSRLLSSYNGSLDLFDLTTGTRLQTLTFDRPVTHPDWSPEGDIVVVALPNSWADASADWNFPGGPLGILHVDGSGTFDATVDLVFDPQDGFNSYYPTFSPDGQWIAFNRSSADAYDDPDASLWIMKPDGSNLVALAAANGEGPLTNSWPRWGPLPDSEILWLTFASRRPYGWVTNGNPQIWVTAIDPLTLQGGEDPSSPPFWLPGQRSDTNNHIPAWGL